MGTAGSIIATPAFTWRPPLQNLLRGFRFQEDGALSQTVAKSAKVVPVYLANCCYNVQ